MLCKSAIYIYNNLNYYKYCRVFSDFMEKVYMFIADYNSWMQSNQGHESFRSVVMAFLKDLSKLTCTAEPFDYHLDHIWAILDRYTTDEDHDEWQVKTVAMDYKASMTKIRIISLVLYRSGVLPKKDVKKKQFPIDVKSIKVGIKGGMTSHIKEDLGFTDILFNHMRIISMLSSRRMDVTIHLDALWFLLSPYVTQEDYYLWKTNNETFGNEESPKYHRYMWNIKKERIIVGVMDRADFLWKSTMVDAPEEYATKDGDINVRSSITKR